MASRTSEPGIRPGPMSLLVLTLVVCLSVLCCLALATSAASYHRAAMEASMLEDSYTNEREAQELYAHASELVAGQGPAGLEALAQEAPQRWPGCSATFEAGRLEACFVQPSGRSLAVTMSCTSEGQLTLEEWCAGMEWEEPGTSWWPGPSSG